MLERSQILPVGSLITIRHETDKGKETVCVVVGHLTLRRDIISRFDYTCVKFPQGVEDGLIYVNHDDIVNTIHRASDYDELNEVWMNRKYAEYVAYYKHYGEFQRPEIDKIRQNIFQVDPPAKRKNFIAQITILIISISGAALLSVLSGTWMTSVGAALFMLAGYCIKK